MNRQPTPPDAWNALLRLLRYRPRSCAEVRTRLAQLGFPDHDIDTVIEQGKAAGLLDDRLFTKLWIEDRRAHHPLSRRAVARELHDKGIDTELVTALMTELYPAEDETKIALDLARTRMARYRGVDGATRMRRTFNFLVRRGFNPALARKVVREVEKEYE